MITTFDEEFCLEPESGKCNVTDNTNVVYRPVSTHCRGAEAMFIFNKNTGKLTHKCSGKDACMKDGSSSTRTEFVISSTCPEPATDVRLTRTYCEFNFTNNLP